jgi:TRAP transporter TAXI family solute receptor
MKKTPSMLFLFLGLTILASCEEQKTHFVTIGTGGVTGLYYPTGGAIARMINKRHDQYKIKMTVESTAGSVYNINAVLSGDLEFGVAQSDRQYQAYHGLAEWSELGEQTELRSIFSIHSESITLIAAQQSGIREVMDLRGRRVNLGNPGSGQLQNSRDVLTAVNLSEDDITAEYVKAVEAPGLLNDERIDAFFYTVGHPNGNIKEATAGRIKVFIVPIRGTGIDAMVERLPYYAPSTISRSFYPQALNAEDIETVGVKATLVASQEVNPKIVYAITREVFENLDDFKQLHPAYQVLTKENMLKGLSAPIHRGALRYYMEAGLEGHIDPKLMMAER